MRELNGIELASVSGGLMEFITTWSSDGGGGFGGDWGGDWGGDVDFQTTGDFARLDRSGTVVDYCGAGTTAFIPDRPWGVDFSGACSAHDDCYAEAIVPRATCDSQFLTDMLNASGSNLLGIGTSYVYYSAVSLFGGVAYAQ